MSDDRAPRREPPIPSPAELAARLNRGSSAAPATEPEAAVPAAPGEPAPFPARVVRGESLRELAARLNQRVAQEAAPDAPADRPVAFEDRDEIDEDGFDAGISFRELVQRREGRSPGLVFRVAGELFAIELARAEEALDLPVLHPMPEMPDGMLGVVDLRGRALRVFSPEGPLGVAPAAGAALLVVSAGGRQVGLAVDDIDDVLDVEGAELRRPPRVEKGEPVLLAVARRAGDLVSLIDAEALVADLLTDRTPGPSESE